MPGSLALHQWETILDQLSRPIADQAPEQLETQFEALADLLSALGMASESAQARSWTLVPPPHQEWQQQLQRWDQSLRNPLAIQHLNTRSDQAAALQHVEHLLDQGMTREALVILETLAADNQYPAHLCNKLGYLHERNRDYWQAERWYRTSLHANPTQVQTWCTLAACLLQQEAADEALECAQQALALHPNHPWPLKLQQRALLKLGASSQLAGLKQRNLLPLEELPQADPWLHRQSQDPFARRDPAIPDLAALMALRSCLSERNPQIWAIGAESLALLHWLGQHGLAHGQPTPVQHFGGFASEAERSQLEQTGLRCPPSLPLYRMRELSGPPALLVVSLQHLPGCPLPIGTRLHNSATALLCHGKPLSSEALVPRQPITISPHWTLWKAP